MKKYKLSEFEEAVILTIGVLGKEAYGVSIKREIERRLSIKVSLGALQSALRRLERNGYLSTRLGETIWERAGLPKKYFEITAYGRISLLFEWNLYLSSLEQCFEEIRTNYLLEDVTLTKLKQES